MNDVLPKPFTKEGMLKALTKHLQSFLKTAPFPGSAQMPHPGAFPAPNQPHPPLLNMGQLSAAQSLKDDSSPGKAAVTAGPWHSPHQLPSQSPVGNPAAWSMQQPGQGHPYAMGPAPPHPQSGYPAPPNTPLGPPRGPPHRRVISDVAGGVGDDNPEKRQRMYPPNQPGFQQ